MPASACTDTIEDIEDLFINAEKESGDKGSVRKFVYPKVRKSKNLSASETPNAVVAQSIIPGTHSIFIKTWGCTHNTSDSEYMAGQLASYGYRITEDKEEADLWLLNSCTVKNPAEDHFRNDIISGKRLGKHLVLAGCVAQSVPSAGYLNDLSIIGVQQIDRVLEVVEETLKGYTVRLLGKKKHDGRKTGGASLTLPKIRRNALIEIIPISTGCLNHCTYCKTKHARGELGSYPVADIVDRAKQAFQEGIVELWITSEDTGAYGRDIGSSLPELLWSVINVMPEQCMLRVGMTNPPYILEHLEEMAKILNHSNVYAFLHIPVQSGSDPVLSDMKREYCRTDFETVVEFLKDRVLGVTIATDVICGFPTETEQDFEETLSLIKQYKFPSLFINQFYPRPGTPAAKMPKIPTHEVKKRTKKVSELFASYFPYEHKLQETQRVLVTELSSDKQYYIGHNKFYEQVLVPKVEGYMGHWMEVEIVSTGKHFLKGCPISESQITSPGLSKPLPNGAISGILNKNCTKSDIATTMKMSSGHCERFDYVLVTFLVVFVGWLLHKTLSLWTIFIER